jgi:Tfp pilus assembly protein PilN
MNYTSNLKEQEKNNREDQYVKIHAFDEQFSKINAQVAAISAVEKNQLYWSDLFSRLNGMIFPGIELNIVETKDYNVTLFGLANSRDDLILFKEKLENSDCLFNINLPLSELVEKNNVEFQMDLEIKPECLRKKQ